MAGVWRWLIAKSTGSIRCISAPARQDQLRINSRVPYRQVVKAAFRFAGRQLFPCSSIGSKQTELSCFPITVDNSLFHVENLLSLWIVGTLST